MKLAIPTICPHIYHEGKWWSYEPFVLEMNLWAQLFSELIMVAPLESGEPPPFWTPYATDKIRVIPFAKGKGTGLVQPRTTLADLVPMVTALLKARKQADAFHLRSPGSISLVASLLVPFFGKPFCAKYAGQWISYNGEARSYKFQKFILKSFFWRNSPVTVYGEWATQPKQIVPFFTSVMDKSQMGRAKSIAQDKLFHKPLHILFVGRFSKAKNVNVLLHSIAKINQSGCAVAVTLIGDGPEKLQLENLCKELSLQNVVSFTGGLEFTQVLEHYANADVLVLASETEGWPKAIAEGMAFGLVCIGSNRGLIPWMLGEGRGVTVPPGDVEALAQALRDICEKPVYYHAMGQLAASWAQQYSLEGLRDAIRSLLEERWRVSLPGCEQPPALISKKEVEL